MAERYEDTSSGQICTSPAYHVFTSSSAESSQLSDSSTSSSLLQHVDKSQDYCGSIQNIGTSKVRWEWVEIIEPKTKEPMYANLTTGECVWDPPPGVKIKKTDDNQWWELFDPNTSRFYYYNATSQRTVWQRPQNCDIIPLAKLQTLKQNTEVRDDDSKQICIKREMGTQTPDSRSPRRDHVRTGSLKSSHQTQTCTILARSRFDRQDSLSSHSSSSHEYHINGEQRLRRRGSQPTQSTQQLDRSQDLAIQGRLVRRDSFERSASLRLRDSPRIQRAHISQKNMDSCGTQTPMQTRHGSYRWHDSPSKIDNHSFHGRQGSYGEQGGNYRTDIYCASPLQTKSEIYGSETIIGTDRSIYGGDYSSGKEEFIAFSQDIVNQQGDISPIPHKPKPRSFPRTNPAYVGVPRRDGQTSYKKINVDQSAPAYDIPYQPEQIVMTLQSSQSGNTYSDPYGYNRHDRSDSDTSHSSHRGGYLHERTDSQASHSSRNRDLSDSQSSQGSLRNMSDTHSSQGSLRNMQDSAVSVQDSISSKGSFQSTDQDYACIHERSNNQMSLRSLLQSEPEYANLPFSPQKSDSSLITLSYDQNNFKNILKSKKSSGSDFNEVCLDNRAGSILQDYTYQQCLPGSHRSLITHNSSYHSENIPDQGFEESDTSSALSGSPRLQPHSVQTNSSIDTQHASLKRKKGEKAEPVASPVLEKSQSLQTELAQQRPLSMVVASQSEANVSLSPSTGSLHRQKLSSDRDIENYAQTHLNRHKKGIFGKRVSLANMLAWSKDPIQKPMLRTNDKAVKREACEVFKLIQMYMGDRKPKSTPLQVALEITVKGWTMPSLRDEIFIQLCRQTTENRKEASLQRGWELLAICLSFFPPSLKFYSYLEGYISRHLDPTCDLLEVPVSHFASHCQRRLERALQTGAKKGVRKPALEEIEQSKKSIFYPSMFGSVLVDVMLMQKEKFPERRLPWIQTTLSEEVLRLNGAQTEGIFRVPGDIDEVNALKIRCDQWIPPTDCPDPHVPASLLKLWYRELYEPLIPAAYYEDCIMNYDNSDAAITVVNRLPEINRLVLSYLIRFLQVFAAPENAAVTKMDVNNLAMVMAPNCLRCESEDPKVIFENTRKEMGFIRTLIQNLDTSFMEGII
ncbi:uncharacterized protein LOC115209795 isoform X3 [Octopus sinensis]|uniref:Rho GTPase-activating protein 39 n=1 Tax=Octopus sinensis TaxID=2607531 RepID=A0A6P7S7W0_9MOLL|nr:uncharacterized protein LOC115209795 isoform X3 [Octopus sinensis]